MKLQSKKEVSPENILSNRPLEVLSESRMSCKKNNISRSLPIRALLQVGVCKILHMAINIVSFVHNCHFCAILCEITVGEEFPLRLRWG